MKFKLKLVSWVAWICLLGTFDGPVYGQPDTAEIVARLIKRDKELQQRRKSYDYDLTLVREKLKADKTAREATEEKSVVIADQRPDYETRSDLNPEEEAEKASKEEPFELLKVMDHFTYHLEGTEAVHGVPCYKIAFTPKPNMPYRNREEKVINQVSGFLWVSQKDYSLMRNAGSLKDPVQVGWIFATLKELEFSFESQPLPNGDYGPKQVTYRFLVNIPFGQIHERHIRKMTKFRSSRGGAAEKSATGTKASADKAL